MPNTATKIHFHSKVSFPLLCLSLLPLTAVRTTSGGIDLIADPLAPCFRSLMDGAVGSADQVQILAIMTKLVRVKQISGCNAWRIFL